MSTAQLNLHVREGTDVLHRVLGVCRRRGLEVRRLSYRDGELTLLVAGDHERTSHLCRWLASLVDVLEVG